MHCRADTARFGLDGRGWVVFARSVAGISSFSRCRWGDRGIAACLALAAGLLWPGRGVAAAILADPAVDAFNIRVGTQTFAGRYQFTTNTLLVETAEAIRGMGSDVIKFYLGRDFSRQYRVSLPGSITNLTTLARDEPSCRRVLDMPFRHTLVWAYCFSTLSDTYWTDGMSPSERQKEYTELYAVTRHLLTTYHDSGRSFYLGHWEGDWYLLPGYVTTNNPSPTAIQGMRDWLNTRQQAVDDATRDTPHTNVSVYAYAEVNRVRDAMVNGTNSNQRLVNKVLPAVTNLDFVSWSSYDGQDLSASELTRTLNYIESQLPTNKASVIPGRRVFIGEYGWGGGLSSAAQEPRTRAYLRNLLKWSPRFILFWEIYNNELDRFYWLIDSTGQRTPCYNLHARYANLARLKVAQFRQENARLPNDDEFAALVVPPLATVLPAPVALTISNGPAIEIRSNSARVEGTLVQGIYGDEQARVWLYWGKTDGGTNTSAWDNALDLGLNTRFGPSLFSSLISGLQPATWYFYRFRANQSSGTQWAPSSSTFRTTPPPPRLNGSALNDGRYALRVGEDSLGFAATRCEVQAAASLSSPIEWLTVLATNDATLPFAWTDSAALSLTQRFYRVILGP